MKKFLNGFVLCILFLLPYSSQATRLAPYHYLNIIKNTIGGDGTFGFSLETFNPMSGFSADLQVTTQNGSGEYPSYDIQNSMHIGTGNSYFLSEDPQPGWEQQSISCTNDIYGSIGTQTNDGVILPYYAYTTTTCTVINQKQSGEKTPVLIVPGVLGTDIYKGSNLLWANTKMATGFDGFMDPLDFNSDLTPVDNSLVATDVIRKLTFNTGVLKFKVFDYTDGLINQLTSSGIGYTEGKDLFTFPYDWRYGASEDIVNQLKGEVNYILTQTDAGKAAGKVDVIAHSTGGLILKRYIKENPVTHGIGKAIFVGVPNLGTPQALKVLLEGDDFGIFGLDPQEMKKISQNMPVIYNLIADQQYVDQAGSFMRVGVLNLYNPSYKDLNYSELQNYLTNAGFNKSALDNSSQLHSSDFDNFDVRATGVDAYNIVGCKTDTLGKILDEQDINGKHLEFDPNPDRSFSGDGTVTFASADSLAVDGSKTFFVPKIQHSNLLSADGSRQEIVNLITGSNLDTGDKILTHDAVQANPKLCEIKGESINIKSPVSVGATDQDGNFSGLAADGSIQNDIPGADYEVWGEHKYVFLPTDEGQTYKISLAGTGAGTFTLDDQSIDGNNITQTQVFSNLPVTPALTGTVSLGGGGQTSLSLQATPASAPVVVYPSSVVNAQQSEDITPPVSTSTITGTMGQPGYYRSNVSVALTATDPIIDNNASTTSGVLNIKYSLDNATTTNYQNPISVTAEGAHTISFFSTDKAGNNEQSQTVNFIVDKTAPEAVVQFNSALKDIQFTGSDNISTTSKITVADNVNDILLTDQAGNTTDIKLKEKNRKASMQSTLQSLSYNGTSQDISKNTLAFLWAYDKNNNLTMLSQNISAKKTYLILAVYNGKNTSLVGIDKTGIILKSITGLDLLKVTTNKGDLTWGY